MSNLEIIGLRQRYNYGATGVREVSFSLENNESIAVLAREEGGKTSLLKAIAGLYPIQKGEIIINGASVGKLKPKGRDLMLLMGREGLMKGKTLRKNLEFPLKIRKVPKDEIESAIWSVSQKLGIESILDVKAGRLSGDDAVKGVVARALMRKAAVYLFDDVFSEAENRRKLFSELLPHIKHLDGVVVFATTSPDEARSVADNIIILNYGFCVQAGKTEEVVNNPLSVIAYSFFKGAAANTVETKIKEEDGALFVELLGKKILLDKERLLSDIYIGSNVIACFTTRVSSSGTFIKEGYVEFYENLPMLHAKWGEFDIITQLNDDNIDTEWRIAVNKSSLRLFDTDNEKIIYYA